LQIGRGVGVYPIFLDIANDAHSGKDDENFIFTRNQQVESAKVS